MQPLTLEGVQQQLRDGTLTSTALVGRALDRTDALDGPLGVFVTRFDATALAAAERADEAMARGESLGALHGIPLGVKDIIATREGPTTAQSKAHDPAWWPGDATSVARLRQAGAVVIGKTTTMEFAYGTPSREDPFPLPANPWDADRWPGGSSSGTGSGVAAGMMLGGLGTDTAGSVRVPAAWCGISGLKPTFGAVPVEGVVPLAFSADHVGPMARSARDCAVLFEVLSGRAVGDAAESLDGVRVGVDRLARITDGAGDPAAGHHLDAALAGLEGLGAQVVDVELPLYRELTDAVFLTVAAERLTYHAPRLAEQWPRYSRNARLGLARGVYYSAADYVQAQRVRALGQRRLADVFAGVDVIVTATASIGAPLLDELDQCMARWKQLVHTTYWNAVGNPVLSVPMGHTATGLPLGLQIAGRPFEDATVLRVGETFQRVTDWHAQTPTGESDGALRAGA